MIFLNKLLKIIISVFLIPILIGSIFSLYKLINLSGKAESIYWMIIIGVIIWILFYIIFPEPKWLYVFGHESTHAIWSILFGGKLKKFSVRSSGGHVGITKSNFLVTLAPYFFPFYSILVFVLYFIVSKFFNVSKYYNVFYLIIGFTYAFHITLTYKILKIKQPDIKKEGFLFSIIIILIGNIAILLIGIPYLTETTTIGSTLNTWFIYSKNIYQYIFNTLILF